jgi:hypothetical protein
MVNLRLFYHSNKVSIKNPNLSKGLGKTFKYSYALIMAQLNICSSAVSLAVEQ